MSWDLVGERPIYAQLLDELQMRIITGFYQAGQRLPSVRDLAQEAAVNANTMQRALSELEQEGLVYAQRTTGRYITDDQAKIKQLRISIAQKHTLSYIKGMRSLGYSNEQALELTGFRHLS